jgi:subtilase family serine protease
VVRLSCRRVAVAGVIALLGPSAAAVASPLAPAVAAQPAAAPIVTVAKPAKHHKTARLCSTVQKAGRATCFAIQQTDTVQPPGVRVNAVSPQAPPAGYGPSTLVAAYKLDQSKGSGQTVAVVDAYDDPNAESDLAAYRTQYGLAACTTAGGCFKKVSQSGSTTNLPLPNAGWAGEISLDLDMVSATCPKCRILLVEATNNSLLSLGTAVNRAVAMGAKYVSNSYGAPEFSSEASFDSAYFHHPGVAITASTGDGNYGASYPATGANVTAVGGTSLTSANNTRGWTESVWNTKPTEGTGSGCSSSVAKPSFQTNLTTGCSNRAEADVSAVSDPNTGVAVFNTYGDSGWRVYGGTSAASPIIASVYALAGAPGASDSPNAYPYAHHSYLYDVTSGNNGTCSPAVLCTAGTGWDGPTGLGTPNGTAAFTNVNIISITNPGTQTGAVGSLQSLQIQASDVVPGSQLSYAASGLPTGLAINPRTGLISGTVSAAGPYTVSITATDNTTTSGSATFSWVFQAPGALSTVSPVRVLDTRIGNGAAKAPVAAGADLVVQITGKGGIPATAVSAVVVNVTVTAPTSSG